MINYSVPVDYNLKVRVLNRPEQLVWPAPNGKSLALQNSGFHQRTVGAGRSTDTHIHHPGDMLDRLKRILPSGMEKRLWHLKEDLIWSTREATWRFRPLPDFIIIGAQKSGTTSLFFYLSQHPEIVPPLKKEIHYFDGGLKPNVDNYCKGEPWYRAHFPLKGNLAPGQIVFEASPLYLYNPLAPRRIFDLMPDVKMIVLLRNPINRAISQFNHNKRQGKEPLSLFEALKKEEARMRPAVEQNDYKSDLFRRYSYKSRGLYKEQLERYFNHFSRDQLLILPSKVFFTQTRKTLRRIFDFVGVSEDFQVKDLTPRNVSHKNRNVPPAVYQYLDSFFKPHNQALFDLLGEDLGLDVNVD